MTNRASQVAPVVKNPPAKAIDPWGGKIPWGKKWQTTQVFLPEKLHGQRSVMGYSPRGLKASDMTERASVTHGAEHLSIHSLAICVSFLEKCLF